MEIHYRSAEPGLKAGDDTSKARDNVCFWCSHQYFSNIRHDNIALLRNRDRIAAKHCNHSVSKLPIRSCSDPSHLTFHKNWLSTVRIESIPLFVRPTGRSIQKRFLAVGKRGGPCAVGRCGDVDPILYSLVLSRVLFVLLDFQPMERLSSP